jgi:hypothetical protein
VTEYLKAAGVSTEKFHDTVSTSQNENLNRIVDWHNDIAFHGAAYDYVVSVHFNAYTHTSSPRGCEVLWVTQEELAAEVSEAIADAGDFIDRGAKFRDDLFVLNNTREKAILIEVCFVDSEADVENYRNNFDLICLAIAETIGEITVAPIPPEPEPPEPQPPDDVFRVSGKCSSFGGPEDTGVSASEGLAFIYDYEDAPHLFLPQQPEGTTGLARRLNPGIFYVACRWDYDVTPKGMLANPSLQALVRAGDREFLAWAADWGPHEDTGRVADLSPGLMEALDLETDDEVEVIYPAR